MKRRRFPVIWLPIAILLGWIGCAIPWGKPTGFHGTGLPIPVAIWDKPKGSDQFLDYPNPWGLVEKPLVLYGAGILAWGVYRCARFLVLRCASRKNRISGSGTTMSRNEVRGILERFINDSGGPYEWDDFTSVPISDPFLEKIRQRCASLDIEFPPNKPGHFCNDEGTEVIRSFIHTLGVG